MGADKKAFILNYTKKHRGKVMTLESSKTLGGIGAILLFIGAIPVIQYLWVVSVIGAILVLFALRGFADHFKDRAIFSNAVYGVAVAVVGGIIAAILAFAVVLTNLKDLITQLYPGWNGDWASLQGMTPDTSNIDPTALFPFIGGILVVLVIVWIFAIIAAFFVWRSLKQVSNRTNAGLFGTAGLILLIGAIIPVFGLILMWISALILAIAFFNLKPIEHPVETVLSPPPP
jgi:uncharacterized membrane protein